jgi:hypothetical protein
MTSKSPIGLFTSAHAVPNGRPTCDRLVCIYMCETHQWLLDRFHDSEIGAQLREMPDSLVVEVYADPSRAHSRLDGNQLIVSADESYPNLPIKTYRMIEYCVSNIRFKQLIKIDVTTVLRQNELDTAEYGGRRALDQAAVAEFIRTSATGDDYFGFQLHAGAKREAAENWARMKGLVIDYARFFGSDPMTAFYSGKCYGLSRRFAEYIARFGRNTAEEHRQYFPAAEDLMIGRLHEQFSQGGAT